MRRDEHTHPCANCQIKTQCPGHYERNHDGFPEVICTEFHGGGTFLCDECRAHMCESGQAEDCEPYTATETFTPYKDTPAQQKPFPVCKACLKWEQEEAERENERAYERSLDDFYGGSSPQTDQERYDIAAAQKRSAR
jgi:hypothetical protein